MAPISGAGAGVSEAGLPWGLPFRVLPLLLLVVVVVVVLVAGAVLAGREVLSFW